MSVACSFSPANPKLYTTTTGSVTGGVASTAYYMSLANPAGHTQIINFKTDGSGNASILIVPNISGTDTWNIYAIAPTSVANGTFNTSGHT